MPARRWLLLGLVVVLAATARSCATLACEDDAVRMLTALSRHDGWIAPWYHSAYLVIASLLVAPFGDGHEFEALLWASALSSAAAVAALVRAFPVGDTRGWMAAACIACSPGWWANATRVELHGVQLLGGVGLLLGALVMQRATVVTRREIAMFALSVGAAILCHRTNVFLLPGALWLAARGRSSRTWTAAVAASAVTYLVASLVNSREEGAGSALLHQRSFVVLAEFWRGFEPAFFWSELIRFWFPALIAPLVMPPTSWRAVAPALACAAPGLAFFTCFGVPTLGGYFGASLVFVVALAACDGSAPERLRLRSVRSVLAALVLVIGLVVSHREVHSPGREALNGVVEQRLVAAELALPRGGAYFGVDGSHQSLDGRRRGLVDANLFSILLVHHRSGIDTNDASQRIIQLLQAERESGREVALDLSWHEWSELRPMVELYLGGVESFLRARPDVREITTPIGVHLVWAADSHRE